LEHWGLVNYTVNPDVVVPVPKNAVAAGTDASLIQQMFKLKKKQKSEPSALHKTVVGPPKVSCTSCGEDCARVRYTWNNLEVCPDCFANGKFPENSNSSQFTKVELPLEHDPTDWSEQETLLLLEVTHISQLK
jgi:hypothetical protein